MNAQEYIASGLLEAFVLGSLPSREMQEVYAAMDKYPEVADEVAAIEAAVFQLAETQAATPPPHLQERIWATIEASAPAVNGAASHTAAKPSMPKKPTVIPFTPEKKAASPGWARAAVWIALVGSLVANFLLLQQRKSSREEQLALQQRVDTMQKRQQYLAGVLDQYGKESELMADPEMQAIIMRTTQKDHPMAATIYWRRNKGEAYVSVKKLPMPPAGKQYQLWVIDGGKPVDLGVLPNEMISGSGMQKVSKAVAGGQAFAISLEQEGGSPSPTMDQIFVMGKVAT